MSTRTKVSKAAPAAAVRLGRGRRPQARKLRDAKDAMYREHIMGVAERIFADQGFANARMQDIASAAGVSLGTLYLSYAGKQELHRSLLIERDRQMLDLVLSKRQQTMQKPTSVEQILWFMEAHLHFMLQHPDYLRMQLQEGHAWYHRAAQPTADEQQMWERGMMVLEQVFAWGIAQGLFSPGNSAHQARLLMAMQQSRFANWVMDEMREAHDAVIARIQADFVRQFCRPEIVKKLLSADGASLNPQALKRVRELDKSRLAEQPIGA
jgi:AcrR family transcriptional regulator